MYISNKGILYSNIYSRDRPKTLVGRREIAKKSREVGDGPPCVTLLCGCKQYILKQEYSVERQFKVNFDTEI